jgi:hypothetical protein
MTDDDFNGGTVSISYGTINEDDIPLIMQEPTYFTYQRLTSWVGIIIISLLVLVAYVVYAAYQQKKIRGITSNFLINERNSLLKRCDLLSNKIDVPHSKSIEINIPKVSFDSITHSQLDCLFSFYITTTKGHVARLKGSWFANADSYTILLTLSNNIQLKSLVLHTLIDQIFAHGWQNTFNTFNVLVRDKSDRIIWRDTVILDFKTGDSTSGYISGGYIPLQFDLDKYF